MIEDVRSGDKKTCSYQRILVAQLNYQLIDILAEWLLFLIGMLNLLSCSNDNEDMDVSERGFAPGSLNGKEIVFYRDGKWNFASITSNDDTKVRINAEEATIAYDRMAPSST